MMALSGANVRSACSAPSGRSGLGYVNTIVEGWPPALSDKLPRLEACKGGRRWSRGLDKIFDPRLTNDVTVPYSRFDTQFGFSGACYFAALNFSL